MLNTIFEEVKATIPTAEIKTVTKNNGIVLTGITDPTSDFAPIVYYQDGMTADSIIRTLTATPNIDRAEIMDILRNPLRNVKAKLVSKNQDNSAYINMDYLDFSILFYVTVGDGAYITLTPQSTDIAPDALLKASIENMEPDIMSLADMLGMPPMLPMYVISDKTKYNGAACILDPRTLDKVADIMDGDIIILPSSIHECIAIPASMAQSGLLDMVKEINASDVLRPEEVLTDTVYKYGRDTQTLSIYDK